MAENSGKIVGRFRVMKSSTKVGQEANSDNVIKKTSQVISKSYILFCFLGMDTLEQIIIGL